MKWVMKNRTERIYAIDTDTWTFQAAGTQLAFLSKDWKSDVDKDMVRKWLVGGGSTKVLPYEFLE